MDPRDRRHHPRFEGEFQVDLLNMGDDPTISPWEAIVAGKALDISRQGLRLRALYHVKVGSLLSAIVYYRGFDSVCLCEVMWRREEGGAILYGLYVKEWSRLDATLERRLAAMEETNDPPVTPFSGLQPARGATL